MEDKIETVGELIDYLECFDRNTKILDNINPCWWSPRSVDENEPESIIDAMCVATDLQLIDENNNPDQLMFGKYDHYNISFKEEGEYGSSEYTVKDMDCVGEKTIVKIQSPNQKLNNILANAVWGKIQRFMEKEPYVTLD